MRRLPLLPTLLVAAAVAAMIGLGIWQLRRAEWKERLIAEYQAAATMPALDLDPLLGREGTPPPLAFRRVLITCHADNILPEQRGGRNRETGQGGYSSFVPCRSGAGGLAGRIVVNAGWAALPDSDQRLSLNGIVAGQLGPVEGRERIVLTAATARPPLAPSAPPLIEDIPNNHLSYAFQWFFFAATAVVIYLLALRRRAPKLPPEP